MILPVIKQIRRSISQEEVQIVDYLVENNILPRIARYLDQEYIEYGDLQNECAWIISNVAAGKTSLMEYVVKELAALDRYITLVNLPVELNVKESVCLSFYYFLKSI